MQKLMLIVAALLLVAASSLMAWFSQGLDLQTMLIVGTVKGIILVFGIAWIVRRTIVRRTSRESD